MTATPRILVVGPSWIGDMVMAQALFAQLRRRLPMARIDVLAPAATASLVARMPEVDASVVMDIAHGELALGRRRATAARLARHGYDQAIVLQRSFKAALVPWLAGIPRRTGYRGEFRFGLINDARTLDTTRYPLKAEHYALLGLADDNDTLDHLIPPRLRIDTANQQRLVDALSIDRQRPAIGFAAGAAYGAAKQWPVEYYAELAAGFDARGIACWIFGSEDDRTLCDRIAAAAPDHSVNACGRTSLVDIVDLAAIAGQFVGNDTGVMHVASACAPRVVGIYGPTHPDYAPPLAADSRALWLNLSCAPCRKRVCPLGHNACMRDLAVADVRAACIDDTPHAVPALHAQAQYARKPE